MATLDALAPAMDDMRVVIDNFHAYAVPFPPEGP